MNKQLVAYFAAEFERLCNQRGPRGLSTTERRDFVKWLHLEFRRLSRYNGEKHGPCFVHRPRHMVIVHRPPAPPPPMSVPAVLRRPDTEAGLYRLGLPRTAYVRQPVNQARV